MTRKMIAILCLWGTTFAAQAQEWSQFRGPDANGVTSSTGFPTEWDAATNIRWSVDLPQPGNGSVVVYGDYVFVCSAQDSKGTRRSLLCFDATSGQQRWAQTVEIDQEMPTHKTNPFAGSTPACDGQRVYVWHASAGLHAYSLDGEKLWSRDLGEFRHMWGYGSSPVIVDGRVVLNSGPGKNVFVAAFDPESGKTLWMHKEPVEGDGERNAAGKYMGTWSTPVPIKRNGRWQVVVAMHKRIVSLDASDGKVVWFYPVVSDRGDLAYSSPVISGDVCVFNGGFKGPAMGFRFNGTGDLSKNELWRIESNPQSIGTGVIVDGFVYRAGAGANLIECINASTGEIAWQQRRKAAYWGSIALAGNHAYVTDQQGLTLIFRPSPKEFVQISECSVDDTCNSTPALSAKRVYLRTSRKLWCVETQE